MRLLFIAGCALALWIGVLDAEAIWHNAQLSRQEKAVIQQTAVEKAQAAKLQQQIEYYQTSEYRQIQAHIMGLSAPGETEIVVH